MKKAYCPLCGEVCIRTIKTDRRTGVINYKNTVCPARHYEETIENETTIVEINGDRYEYSTHTDYRTLNYIKREIDKAILEYEIRQLALDNDQLPGI